MPFQCNIVEGRTIEDVWREIMWCAVRKGFDYKVEVGATGADRAPAGLCRIKGPGTLHPASGCPGS